jgi:hypothetical protein
MLAMFGVDEVGEEWVWRSGEEDISWEWMKEGSSASQRSPERALLNTRACRGIFVKFCTHGLSVAEPLGPGVIFLYLLRKHPHNF